MGLDIELMLPVHELNLTHNLGEMASNVKLSNGKTLYNYVWRPEEEEDVYYASDIIDYIDEGLRILKAEPDTFKKFNPENGFGTYDGLVKVLEKYVHHLIVYPNAEIKVSR